MDVAQISKQSVAFTRSRGNLLLVIAFSVVNLLLLAFDADIYLLFSATIPYLVYDLSIYYDYATVGLIVAMAMVVMYFAFYLLSKNRRVFILFALIFFSIDSLLFLYLVLVSIVTNGFEIWVLVDVAIHVWIMFYLITGSVAWAKLRKVSVEDLELARVAIANDEAQAARDEEKAALNEISPDGDGDDSDSDKGDSYSPE